MRSRTDGRLLETAARALLLGSLTVLLWRSLSPTGAAETARVDNRSLRASLERWSLGPRPVAVHAELDATPGPVERDWLAALSAAGTRVTWSGGPVPAAIEVRTTAEPRPSFLVRAVAPGGTGMSVRAGGEEIARAEAGSDRISVHAAALAGEVSVGTPGVQARAPVPPASLARHAAVIGTAGWETKFVVAALEEAGWLVDARIAIAPGAVAGSLAPASLDTARHSVAVVMDGADGAWGPALVRFVRAGGGLVIAGGALRSRALLDVMPAAAGREFTRTDTTMVDPAALPAVGLRPAADGVVLEARSESPVVVARRVGSGRVLAVGYRDTWRWRMQGGEGSHQAHRDWWSSIAGAVALSRDTAYARAPESAPLATFVAALGSAVDDARLPSGGRFPRDAFLYALAAVALVAETVSRRRRGAA